MSDHGLLYAIFAPFAMFLGVVGALAFLACAPGLVGWAISGHARTGAQVSVLFWGGTFCVGVVWLCGWAMLEDS